MTAPWERNAGKFDRPSSAPPVLRPASAVAPIAVLSDDDLSPEQIRERYRGVDTLADCLDRRMLEAERQGVVPVGISTICARIDAAIAALIAAGKGHATAIYLIDCDLLALRQATGVACTYRDLRVSSGAASKVYSRRGRATVAREKPCRA